MLKKSQLDYLQQPQELARPKSITRRRVKYHCGIENMDRILVRILKSANCKLFAD
jgi:hypothetical protein